MFINKIIPIVINSFTQHDLHKKLKIMVSSFYNVTKCTIRLGKDEGSDFDESIVRYRQQCNPSGPKVCDGYINLD